MASRCNPLLVALALASLCASCDNRETFHTPDPGLERMLTQPRATPYGASSAFADGRAMRMPVPGTVSRERPWVGQRTIETGHESETSAAEYVENIPVTVTQPLLRQGHVAFERVCATCHGVLGDGVSVVAEKMELRKPPSLHESRIAALLPGKVFEVISAGYGLMPGYAALLDIDERWAVVAYLEALRLSQSIPVARLPITIRSELSQAAP